MRLTRLAGTAVLVSLLFSACQDEPTAPFTERMRPQYDHAPGGSAVIYWGNDANFGESADDPSSFQGFTALRDFWINKGVTTTITDVFPSDFTGVRVFLATSPTATFSAAQLAAFQGFLADGGTLIVSHDGLDPSPSGAQNQLLADLGSVMRFGEIVGSGTQLLATTGVADPLLTDLPAGSTLCTFAHGQVTGGGTALAAREGTNVIVVDDIGGGRILLVADFDMLNNVVTLFFPDSCEPNLFQFWHNILVSGPIDGTLSGVVRVLGTTDPIPNAAITILEAGAVVSSTSTDATGAYSIELPPGTYQVQASATGFQTQISDVTTITSGQTTTEDFDLGVAFSITALNPDGTVAPFVTATLTNIDLAEFFVGCTDANGVATFEVPGGSYLAHIRNLGHDPNEASDPATTLCGTENLSVWPDQQNQFFNTANAAAKNRVGVLFHDTDGSIVLNPDNYRAVAGTPQLVLGVGGPTDIQLQFQTGASLVCNLLDENGDPITLEEDENVNFVLPFGPDGNPVNFTNPEGLPEGIGNLMAALFDGSTADGQGASGAPAGTYACETTPVTVGGETFVYREVLEVTEEEAANGETVTADAEPEPVLSETGYLFEPYGDSQGAVDIGLVTYGFGSDGAGNVTDELHASVDFRSTANRGAAPLYFELVDAAGNILAQAAGACGQVAGSYTCRLVWSDGSYTVSFSGTGTFENGLADGSMTFTVTLPGILEARFRVLTGDGDPSTAVDDRAPDSGHETVTKPTSGGGNSFAVKGE